VQRFKSASACALMAFAWSTRPCAVCSNRAAAYPGVLCLAPYAARVRLDVAGLRLRSVIPCCCWTCLRTAASLPAVPSASLRAEAWSRTVVVADWTVAYPLSTVASSLPTVPGVAADRPAVRWAHGGVVMFRGVVGAGPGKSS